METVKEAIREFTQNICESIKKMNQPIPIRLWVRFKDSNGLRIASHGEQKLNWGPHAYAFVPIIGEAPLLTTIVNALREDPEIATKIVINLDDEKEYIAFNTIKANWLWDRVITPYLDASMHSLRKVAFDDQLFDIVFNDFVKRIQTINPHLTRLTCPILNFRIPYEIDLDKTTKLRPLTLQEMEEWYNHEPFKIIRDLHITDLGYSQSVVEFTIEEPHASDPATRMQRVIRNNQLSQRIQRILRLVTNMPVCFVFTETVSESVLYLNRQILAGQHNQRILNLPEFIPMLNEDQIRLLISLWNSDGSNVNANLIDLALDRLTDAFDRKRDEDKLIDYWVGLESLFAPDANQELKFRAALRIAAFIGKTAEERLSIFEEARASYDWRSATVHGGGKPSKRVVKDFPLNKITSKTGQLLRTAILQIYQSSGEFDITQIEKRLLTDSIQAKGDV
jgi:hypothetical protein